MDPTGVSLLLVAVAGPCAWGLLDWMFYDD